MVTILGSARPTSSKRPRSAAKNRAATADSDSDSMLPAIATQGNSPLPQYADIPAPLAEALRSIVNRYELSTGESLPSSISVTAALPSEGVTTVSQSLATLVAHEMDRFVCWVDCGWLTPDGTNRNSGQPDLLDLLEDNTQIHRAFIPTPDTPQLITLSPGPVPEHKRNLIVRSPAFERLLGVLREEFDHVVFDLPPVLTNANALAMLRQADASLLVVRHRSTTLAQVQQAIESARPTPNLGVVLNRYRTSIPAPLRRLLGG